MPKAVSSTAPTATPVTTLQALQQRWCEAGKKAHLPLSVSRAVPHPHKLHKKTIQRLRSVSAAARDFFSTILDTTGMTNHPPHPMETQSPAQATTETVAALPPGLLTSSSPADPQGSKKRARSALKSHNINDGGSPEKTDVGAVAKPPRKASRASVSSNQENKENVADGQENMMVDV
jgi:hypothetical protein